MPELPEVETIARTLAPCLEGRAVVGISVLNGGTWQGGIRPGLVCAEGPRPVIGTGRRGKLLLVRLAPPAAPDGVTALAFHLKMTGRLFVYPPRTEPGRHTRVIFDLDDGQRLFFDDARKFGYARAVNPAELAAWPFWQKLGPEPLDVDDETFVSLFAGRSAAIKALLFDQKVIAGIGNIYADESLFRAGIRPSVPGGSLGADTLAALRRALVEVLEESITACGSSIRDYRTARGDAGSFQNSFRVYGRGGKPCVNCGRALRQDKVAGRTTVYCPRCQPLRQGSRRGERGGP